MSKGTWPPLGTDRFRPPPPPKRVDVSVCPFWEPGSWLYRETGFLSSRIVLSVIDSTSIAERLLCARSWDNKSPANTLIKRKALCLTCSTQQILRTMLTGDRVPPLYRWGPWSLVSLSNLLTVTLIAADRGFQPRHQMGESMSLTTLLEWG